MGNQIQSRFSVRPHWLIANFSFILPTGLNDFYVFFFSCPSFPKGAYEVLGAKGDREQFLWPANLILTLINCIVPHLKLSVWAFFHNRDPASRFAGTIDSEAYATYTGKALCLIRKGVFNLIEEIWDSLWIEAWLFLSQCSHHPDRKPSDDPHKFWSSS